MDAEIVLAAETREDGVGDRADAYLEARTILDERGDELADARLDVGRRRRSVLRKGAIRVRERRYLRERHHRVPERARHALVDLGEHSAGRDDRRQGGIDRRTERAMAVAVRWRELHERDVERDLPR